MKHSGVVFVVAAVSGACCASALASPTIGVFTAARQGQLNLVDNNGASQFRDAISAAYPSAGFSPMSTITAADLNGVDVVILLSAAAGQGAISPLTASEQNALRAFVNSGGGAVIFTDNDSFAGGASQAANASLVSPFGVTPAGTGAPWQQTATVINTSPLSVVLDGPFGSVQNYSVGWSGWFPNAGAVPGAQTLMYLSQNGQPALVEFTPGMLAPGSGRVVLFSDSTMVFNGYFNESDRVVTLNAIAASIGSHGCGAADVGRSGGLPGSDGQLDNNDFIAFISFFFALDVRADFGVAGGLPGRDGAFDNNDFIAFIGAFFEGCD
ncbi:MAG: GC-type dockerin domain-anchored protein [Phycisphaerales bacterium]